ncbi:hypothetical protein T03_223 [Trichinella britovi]|uniref:Uncharacterized protein n=1 Tax=Trichinella britovi TaxID=45882 RepID=A0A0V1AL62_TRIBR|nr:hypothetical protein T03_223 [Trichinella britovi]
MALQDSTVILSVSSARHLVRNYVLGGSGSLIRQGHLGKSREGWHGNLEAMRPWGSPGQGLVGGTIRDRRARGAGPHRNQKLFF